MKRPLLLLASIAVFAVLTACGESSPTSSNDDRLVIEARTVELLLPWSAFGASVEVFGGFGSPDDLAAMVLANDYRGSLFSRGLLRFGAYPSIVTVRDSLGENRPDSTLTYFGGRLVARVDTLASTVTGPVEVSMSMVTEDWHSPTVTWDNAVDTVGDRRAWTTPGGTAVAVASGTWDPAVSDTLVIELDSAQVALWSDTSSTALRGARLEMVSAGERLELGDIRLRLDARPSVANDTTLALASVVEERTLIYTPFAPPPPDGIRVGGAPAWRTVIRFDLPRVITGPQSVCDAVGCPFTLAPDRVNHASLLLNTRAVDPEAFQPSDTVRIDVRPVLVPERLPKAPLGGSFVGALGRSIGPEAFAVGGAIEIGVPITAFIRTILGEAEPPSRHIALLSVLEPLSLSYASFEGPGSQGEPSLRLIVTLADTLEVR